MRLSSALVGAPAQVRPAAANCSARAGPGCRPPGVVTVIVVVAGQAGLVLLADDPPWGLSSFHWYVVRAPLLAG